MINIETIHRYNVKHKWNVAGIASTLLTNVTYDEAIEFANALGVAHNMEYIMWEAPAPIPALNPVWVSVQVVGGVSGHIWLERIDVN